MRSHHHYAPAPGRVDGPGLLYGGIGLALAVVMQVLGLFKRGDSRLIEALRAPLFHGATPDVLALPVLVVVAAVFCFGLAFAVLDSAATWRRVILGITALVIILAMVPTFALWNIYFSPFLPAIGLFWSWFCTMMYVNHHVMPCDSINSKLPTSHTDVAPVAQPEVGKVEPQLKVEATKKVAKKTSNRANKRKQKKTDPDAKYKPKK